MPCDTAVISCVMLILRAALNMSLNEAPAMLDAGGSGAVLDEADLRPRPAPGGSRAARPATEGDLLICKRTRPVLILKEREIRSVPAVRLAGKSAAETVAVMMAVLRRLDPRLRSSVTFDNHTAFARHGLLTSACAMTTWFCDAYASWQNDRVRCQACFQAVPVRSMALSVTTSLRMQAASASLAGFPARRSRS